MVKENAVFIGKHHTRRTGASCAKSRNSLGWVWINSGWFENCSFHTYNRICCISIGFPLFWEQCPPFPYLGEKQMCMWDGVSVELRAGSPLQGPGGGPELGVSRKLEAQILGGKLGGWASSWGTTVHMWPLSEGWAPLLDSELCLLGQGEWWGAIYSPQFPLHVWASVEPLLSSCEQRNARSFISCEQGSKLHLPVLTSGSEPGPLSAGSSFILLSSALCSIYYDGRITVLQVHFFFLACAL